MKQPFITNSDILIEYTNGNVSVKLYSDGTKFRTYDGEAKPNFPESIDVKITDYCDMNCLYCHESSTVEGKAGDLEKLMLILDELPKGIELAIGGGNPLSHPDILTFLQKCKEKGFHCNVTVNQGHLQRYHDMIKMLIEENLVKGIGISIVNNNLKYVEMLKELSSNVVFHMIAGVNTLEQLDTIINKFANSKILVLGYKTYGFGKDYHTDDIELSIKRWKVLLPKYMKSAIFAFDNLGLKQLDIQRLLLKKDWDTLYMGEDFTHTMYIDAIQQVYAKTSTSSERTPFSETTLLHYFKHDKQ